MLDIIIDALLDSIKMLPFLFGAYLIIEFLEHKSSDKFVNTLLKLGPIGSVVGAILGCIPQCGFSVAAANLYAGRLISAGTLVAVFISTSDEAIPIMLAHPDKIGLMWQLLLVKVIIAIIAGVCIDIILKFVFKKSAADEKPFEVICHDCGCAKNLWLSAVKHTVNIFAFILIINILLNSAITFISEDKLAELLLSGNVLQPLLAGLIGFIPNCASSVLLTELYMRGSISFSAVITGLSTGAGVGMAVLFRANKNLKQNLAIAATIYFISVAAGLFLQFVPIF